MEVVLVAAVARNGCIGSQGSLPWHYPADLRHFRRVSASHPVVMGRRTWESLPRRPLPRRLNVVISRQADYAVPTGVRRCPTMAAALSICRASEATRAIIAGGAEVYRLALPLADELVITWVPDTPAGDTFFPPWNQGDWEVRDRRCQPPLEFVTYRRRAVP